VKEIWLNVWCGATARVLPLTPVNCLCDARDCKHSAFLVEADVFVSVHRHTPFGIIMQSEHADLWHKGRREGKDALGLQLQGEINYLPEFGRPPMVSHPKGASLGLPCAMCRAQLLPNRIALMHWKSAPR
jgi:hypothetical protein